MNELLTSLLLIFSFITLIPIIAKFMRLPVIVTEVMIGIILGKTLFDVIPLDNDIISFFADFGLVYLMFLAGLEIRITGLTKDIGKPLIIAMSSVFIPFVIGAFVGQLIGAHSLMIGTIFSTTSLGLVFSLSKEFNLSGKINDTLLQSVLLVDIVSMFLLAFTLTYILESGYVKIEFIYSSLIVLSLFFIPWFVGRFDLKNKIAMVLSKQIRFDMEVRFSFALIFVLASISEFLGFHSILGAFIAGLITAEITSHAGDVGRKLSSFGYGFFIPLFFIFVGAQIDLIDLFGNTNNILILCTVILLGIFSKTLGAGVSASLLGFTKKESIVIGLLHSVRLALIIAIAEIGHQYMLIDDDLYGIFVIFAIITTIISPTICKYILDKKKLDWRTNLEKHIGNKLFD